MKIANSISENGTLESGEFGVLVWLDELEKCLKEFSGKQKQEEGGPLTITITTDSGALVHSGDDYISFDFKGGNLRRDFGPINVPCDNSRLIIKPEVLQRTLIESIGKPGVGNNPN